MEKSKKASQVIEELSKQIQKFFDVYFSSAGMDWNEIEKLSEKTDQIWQSSDLSDRGIDQVVRGFCNEELEERILGGSRQEEEESRIIEGLLKDHFHLKDH